MAQTLETLSIKLTGDAKDYSDALDTAKSKTSAFSSLAQGALMGVGLGAINMAAQAGTALVGFAQDGIGMASDLSETMSKVGVVFQDNAAAVKAWGADAADALGMSQAEALGAAGTFGNLFVSMGMTSDTSADMSMDLVQLAADLASFNNIDADVALEKLRAGMLGQAEPMQTLGVNMTAAAVSAKAMEMGLADATGELTPAALAQARYAIILEQTATATNDFAETSGGLAAQQKKSAAQWKDLQTKVGAMFLPAITAATTFINTSVIPAVEDFIDIIGSLINYFKLVIDDGDTLNDWLDHLPEPMQGVVQFIAEHLIPGFQSISDFFTSTLGPAIDQAKGFFTDLGDTMQGQADGPMAYLHDWFAENMPRIQAIVENVLNAITSFWEQHGAAITAAVQTLLGWLVQFWDVQFKTILDIVTVALQLLTGDFEGAGNTLQGILQRWYQFFQETILSIANGIRTWFQSVDWAQVGQQVMMGITGGIQAAISLLQTIGSMAVERFKYEWNSIDWGGIGRAILEGIAEGIRNGASLIDNAAADAAQSAFEEAKRFLGIGSPSKLAAEEIGQPFAEGIGVGIGDALGSMTRQVAGSLDGMMGGLSAGMAGAGVGGGGFGAATVNQNFYGATDAASVRSASLSGVRASLRAVGAK